MAKHRLSDLRFEPLEVQNASEHEILAITTNVELSRPLNSSELGRLLISGTPNTFDHQWLVEPGSQPTPVKWSGVGHIDFLKSGPWRTFGRGFRRTFSIVVTFFLILLIAAQLTGVLHFRIVRSGSMSPSIKRGDIIVTAPTYLSKPHVGSVVVYEVRNYQGQGIAQVSHRIIGGSGKLGWIVKGDANKIPDDQHPRTSQVLGVVVAVLPHAGYFANPLDGIFVILVLVIYWTFSALRLRQRRRRRRR
jgi:signal peptidase I